MHKKCVGAVSALIMRPTTGCSFILVALCLLLASITAFVILYLEERAPSGRDVAEESSMPLTNLHTVEMLRDMVRSLETTITGKKPVLLPRNENPLEPVDVVDKLNSLLPTYFKSGERMRYPNSGGNNAIRLLLIVKSAPSNFEKRLHTRQSWLTIALQASNCQCHLHAGRCTRFSRLCQYRHLLWYQRFLVGMDNDNSDLMRDVIKDGMEHLDMLWYPEEDHYRRLTWKVHWAMVWAMKHLTLDYLMFVDDDSFLHLPHLAMYLSTAPRRRLYGGRVPYADPHVVRQKTSKWYVKEEAFPSPHYPQYVWGAGLLMTPDVVELFVERSRHQKMWFSVDDAFIGYVLNVSGLSPTNIKAIYPASSVYHGCDAGLESQEPILITSIDEDHRRTMTDYAMGSISLCSLLIWPMWWKLRITLRTYPLVVILVLFAILLCRPQRRYLLRLIVYV